MIHLETSDKYYCLTSCRDLLGDLVIICDYGSKYSRRHYRHNVKVNDTEELNSIIDQIISKRIRRGYKIVYDKR